MKASVRNPHNRSARLGLVVRPDSWPPNGQINRNVTDGKRDALNNPEKRGVETKGRPRLNTSWSCAECVERVGQCRPTTARDIDEKSERTRRVVWAIQVRNAQDDDVARRCHHVQDI